MLPGGHQGLPYGAGALELPQTSIQLDPVESVLPTEPPSRLTTAEMTGRIQDLAGRLIAGAAGESRSLLVVVSDGSRKTGVDLYLPALVSLLEDSGAVDIRFVVATGLHRRPRAEEVSRILGREIAERFPIFLHDPDDGGKLAQLGVTSRGTVVQVNRLLLEQDQVLLTGAVGFHYHAGFSGGRKSVVPGLAGRTTILGNHLRTLRDDGSRHPGSRAGGLDGNPVHEDMMEAAAMAGSPMIVNAVLNEAGSPEGIWIGAMDHAHRQACEYLLRTRSLSLPPRELVVVSGGGHPSDINLIQAHKAFEAAFPAVTPGGTVILAAECPDGLGDEEFRSGIEAGSEDELAASLLEDYRVYAQTALSWRRKLASCRLILVSSLAPEQVRLAGAEPAASLAEALDTASAGPGCRGWLFRQGARWLVNGS